MTTVLIVEDDPINFRVFAKILTKRGGLEVKGTEDVEEGASYCSGQGSGRDLNGCLPLP